MNLLSNYLCRRRISKILPYVKGSVLDLGCGEGAYRVEQIQPEGRRAMSGREFLAGRPKAIGRRFEGKAPS